MLIPDLPAPAVTRDSTTVFAGLRLSGRPADGEFVRTENLSTDRYPLLAPRRPRAVAAALTDPGGLIEKDALGYVANGTLYFAGAPTPLTGLSHGKKQLVGMGAYICVFPDKKYYNTADSSDYGSMDAEFVLTGTVSLAPCRYDGSLYSTEPTSSDAAPENPENDALWLDTGSGAAPVLRQYSAALDTWAEVATPCTRVTLTSQGSVPALFAQYDGVSVAGLPLDELNGEKIIYALGGASGSAPESDYLVLPGVCPASADYEGVTLSVARRVPDMDYVCQCRNRLWGCRYGNDGAQNLNEIYCCALGDFKNWSQYLGLSTDSWRASVGSDGAFTGAAGYLSQPVFFKENCIHRVTVSASGAHSIGETPCRGVQKGSAESVVLVGDSLFYKSRADVCVWQGGFPESVSEALGAEQYTDAAAGALGGKYYISMKNSAGEWGLYVYDSLLGIWLHEDLLHATAFAAVDGELFCLDSDGRLIALTGSTGTPETGVNWSAETGIMYFLQPEHKYLHRLSLRLTMGVGSSVKAEIEYDSSGKWETAGQLANTGAECPPAMELPLLPRRCDHLRLRISGSGDVKLHALHRYLETGSEL